jgi:hypothetical protein
MEEGEIVEDEYSTVQQMSGNVRKKGVERNNSSLQRGHKCVMGNYNTSR